MNSLQRARSPAEYIELINQVLFEVEDLRACLEWDCDDDAQQLARRVPYLAPLERAVRELHRSMVEGNYQFATGDLPFMAILDRYPDQLPFAGLLRRINATHCEGIDIDSP